MKTQFIFLGAPASGKGTQTKMLAEELNIPHIDTGGMLRAAVAEGTEFGKIAKSCMEQGKLVPSEIVVGIIKERLQKSDVQNGFILDGFPRSIEQAQELDKILEELNSGKDVKVLAINIDVPQSILIDRVVNRRSCKDCGAIYNLKFFPPKNGTTCDKCNGELLQRKDDNEETALNRIETYNKETQPLIEYYENKKILININGDREVSAIYQDIKSIKK